jgi:hypothetical protein
VDVFVQVGTRIDDRAWFYVGGHVCKDEG